MATAMQRMGTLQGVQPQKPWFEWQSPENKSLMQDQKDAVDLQKQKQEISTRFKRFGLANSDALADRYLSNRNFAFQMDRQFDPLSLK